MTDIDELTDLMLESKVDPTALGQHPRYSQFKNAAKAAEQQADRRREAIERQKNRFMDAVNHVRNLAENLESDDEVENEDQPLDLSITREREPRKPRYADELMLSEWLVDIPQTLSAEWLMVPAPVGRRALVVANRGVTSAYSKAGRLMHQFKSQLPCSGSGRFTILDCILANNKFYVIDILSWNSNVYYDLPYDNRRFLLQSHLDDSPALKISKKSCKFTFEMLPACACEKQQMEAMMHSEFEFELDGLLFYYSQVLYVAGQSPLVGWLKPFMLPEILGVNVPEKYVEANKAKLTSDQFIEQYNKKHKHVSQIVKDEVMVASGE